MKIAPKLKRRAVGCIVQIASNNGQAPQFVRLSLSAAADFAGAVAGDKAALKRLQEAIASAT